MQHDNLSSKILDASGKPFVQSSSGITSVRNGFAAGLGGLFGCGDREATCEIKSPLQGLGLAANWRCLQYLGHACGKTPLEAKKRDPAGGEFTYDNHPASLLLHGEANRLPQSSYAWKYQMAQHAAYLGNAVSYICRDENGRPTALVKFEQGEYAIAKVDGRLQYDLKIGNEWYINVDPYDIFHLWFWSWDGMIGIPFWMFHAKQLGMGVAADEFAARYMSGCGQPLATLTLPRGLNPDPTSKEFIDYVESYKRAMAKFGREYRLLMLRPGQEYDPISHNAKDAQLDESRTSFGRDVCMLYGFPPFILGHDLDSNAYKDLTTKNDMTVDGLDPFFCKFESESDVKLRTENQKRTRACRFLFDRDKLRSMDRKSFIELIAAKVRAGVMTTAEARIATNQPLTGQEGEDCLLMDAGVVTLESLCRTTANEPAIGDPEDKDDDETSIDDDPKGENPAEIDDETPFSVPKPLIDDAHRRTIAAVKNAYQRRLRAEDPAAVLALIQPNAQLYSRVDRIFAPLAELDPTIADHGREFAMSELIQLIQGQGTKQ